MRTRPWPLVILAIFHILAPIGNMLISCYLSHANVVTYIQSFRSLFDALQFFMIFPVAGFAIYAMKKWSYPIFLVAMLWGFYVNYDTWHNYPQLFPLTLLIFIYVVNTAIVSYFLIPAVRMVYFNPRLRWWESKPRYRLGVSSHVKRSEGSQFDCEIGNISEGGVFLATAAGAVNTDEEIRLVFEFYQLDFDLPAKVMYLGAVDGRMGCGVQFVGLTREQTRQVKKLVNALELLGAERRPAREAKWQSFTTWLQELIQTGKGIVPNVPRPSNQTGSAQEKP